MQGTGRKRLLRSEQRDRAEERQRERMRGRFEDKRMDDISHFAQRVPRYLSASVIVLRAPGNVAITVSQVRCVVHERKAVTRSKKGRARKCAITVEFAIQ